MAMALRALQLVCLAQAASVFAASETDIGATCLSGLRADCDAKAGSAAGGDGGGGGCDACRVRGLAAGCSQAEVRQFCRDLLAAAASCGFYVAAGGPQLQAVPQGAPAGVVSLPSLAAAQGAVRAVLGAAANQELDNDLVVCLAPGTHHVTGDAPLSFDASDSSYGSGRVIWRGLGTEATGPSIVTGGTQVSGWKTTTLGGGPTFSAAVPAAAAKLVAVRQLWVQGVRANRTAVATDVNCSIGCTTPNASKTVDCAPSSAQAAHRCPPSAPRCVGFESNVHWGHCEHCHCRSENALPVLMPWVTKGAAGTPTAVGYTTTGGTTALPSSWAGSIPNTIEFVWPVVIRNWIEPRCTVASIAGNNITLSSPCGLHLFTRHGGAPPAPGRIEAAYPMGPLAPGEMYHDAAAGMLFYQLAPGQTEAQLNAGAWIASKEVLVELVGTTGHNWQSVQFSHSTWMQPNSLDGFVDSQATVFACTAGSDGCNLGTSGESLGAVRVSGGKDLSFSGCEFSHHGSAYGLSVLGGSKRVSVTQSTFKDLSGGFLKLGSVGKDNTATDESSWDEGFSVTHNIAHTQAVEYGGAPGYFGGFISHSTISHNVRVFKARTCCQNSCLTSPALICGHTQTVSDAGYSGFSQGWGWGGTHAAGKCHKTTAAPATASCI